MSDILEMKAVFDALPEHLVKALQRYQTAKPEADLGGEFYTYALNAALRAHASQRALQQDVLDLDAAIAEYTLKAPVTLYRGETDGERFSGLQLGKTFSQACFVSTSTRWNNLHTHLKRSQPGPVVVFTLRVLNGVSAAYLGSNESEVLLGRNRSYKAISVSDGDPQNYVSGGTKVTSLREVILEVS